MLLFSTLTSGDYSLIGALCTVFVLPTLVIVIFTSIEVKRDFYKGKEANNPNV
jgi:putative spermidine/putrescine transport system permease protein